MRDLLAFLADTGRLTGAAARRLGRELDQVAPRFAGAVMDPSRWGMARSLTQAMVTEGVDITDSAAVQDWIATYNASAPEPPEDWDFDEEDENLKEAFGLPDRLPAMRLPALDELAALARKSPLLATAVRLAEWAGPGRAVDAGRRADRRGHDRGRRGARHRDRRPRGRHGHVRRAGTGSPVGPRPGRRVPRG